METLKPREQKIFDFMKREVAKKGYPPTVREVCAALNISSTSTVHKDLLRIESKGYIKKDGAKPRAIAFVEKVKKGTHESELARANAITVPLVGNIAAGVPITAEQNIEAYFPVPAEYVRGDNFLLTVRGDSMVGAGIFDGDKILVREQQTARNGEVVVALLQDYEAEATVKTYYKESGGEVRLQPENKAYKPIISKDVQILGVVKGVFRYLQ